MLITKYRSSPSTPVRFSSLHSMMMRGVELAFGALGDAIDGTPGKAISGAGAASWFTTSTCLPSARSANAIASCDPMESPSGRACELITNRWRARIASRMRCDSGRRYWSLSSDGWDILCGVARRWRGSPAAAPRRAPGGRSTCRRRTQSPARAGAAGAGPSWRRMNGVDARQRLLGRRAARSASPSAV